MGIEQVIKQKEQKQKNLKQETQKTQEEANTEDLQKKRGRPKGSKNKDKKEATLTHIPHPQLSQSVFTVFDKGIKLSNILKLLILTDKACFKGVIYSLKNRIF